MVKTSQHGDIRLLYVLLSWLLTTRLYWLRLQPKSRIRRDSIPRRAGLLGEPTKLNHPALLETSRSGFFFLKVRIVPSLGQNAGFTRQGPQCEPRGCMFRAMIHDRSFTELNHIEIKVELWRQILTRLIAR